MSIKSQAFNHIKTIIAIYTIQQEIKRISNESGSNMEKRENLLKRRNMLLNDVLSFIADQEIDIIWSSTRIIGQPTHRTILLDEVLIAYDEIIERKCNHSRDKTICAREEFQTLTPMALNIFLKGLIGLDIHPKGLIKYIGH